MPSFEQRYNAMQEAIREAKMRMIARRSYAIEKRSKIKPTIMKPSLAEMSKLRGGDITIPPEEDLELYWPDR
jgi:hypothetical protein